VELDVLVSVLAKEFVFALIAVMTRACALMITVYRTKTEMDAPTLPTTAMTITIVLMISAIHWLDVNTPRLHAMIRMNVPLILAILDQAVSLPPKTATTTMLVPLIRALLVLVLALAVTTPLLIAIAALNPSRLPARKLIVKKLSVIQRMVNARALLLIVMMEIFAAMKYVIPTLVIAHIPHWIVTTRMPAPMTAATEPMDAFTPLST